MSRSLAVLAAQLKAEILRGNPDLPISGVANLLDAEPGQLAPFTDTFYTPQLINCKASAILTHRKINPNDVPESIALLVCDDPEMAFIDLVHLFNPVEPRKPGIHPSAQIDPGAKLGADVHIGPNVFIEANTRIGARCVILANSVIGEGSELGDDCIIHPNVTLYTRVKIGHRVIVHSGSVIGADGFGYKFRKGRFAKVPQVGTVEIADDVEVGANTCIDRGALGATRIGTGTKIDNLVQIAHNNDVGKHCILCGQVALAGSCKLDDYVMLGGNVGLSDHTSMGKGATAGAKSGLSGHIPAGSEVWGLFARPKRETFKSYAALRHLPDLVERVKELEKKLKALEK